MTTLQLLKEYLRLWFSERLPEQALSLLTDDIHGYGLFSGQTIQCLEQARDSLRTIEQQLPAPLTILEECEPSEDSAVIVYTFDHDASSSQQRLLGVSRMTEQGRRLYLMERTAIPSTQKPAAAQKASASPLYDFSDSEHSNLLNGLINDVNGGIALYRVEENWRMTTLFANAGVGRLSGMNQQEYLSLCGADAMQSVFSSDRPAVMNALRNALSHDKVTSLTYRIPDSKGGYRWINAFFSHFGEDNGRPILRVVYTPASIQCDLQSQALNQDETGVYIIDSDTNELYYANHAAFRLHDAAYSDYTGKTCYDAFYGTCHQCTNCWRSNYHPMQKNVLACHGNRILSVTAEPQEWNGHNMVVVYQQDVTEQQKLKQRAEESNRALQQLLRYIACGVCMIEIHDDGSFYVKYFSDGFCTLCEGTLEEIQDFYRDDFCHGVNPEDVPRIKTFIHRLMADGGADEITYSLQTLKGHSKWVTAKISVLCGEDGIKYVYATCFDVTDQMQVQRQLRQEEEMLHTACDFAHIWTWIYHIEEDAIHASKQFQEDFGLPYYLPNFPESWFSMGFILPEFIPLHRDKVQAIKAGSSSEEFEARIRHKDGSVHWSRIRFNRLARNPNIAICTAQLIDDEKILQARVRLERQKMFSSDRTMIGYIVSNVSKNTVLEQDILHTSIPAVEAGLPLETALNAIEPLISDADRKKYLELHTPTLLLQTYKNGTTSFEFEGHYLDHDVLLWFRSVFNLLKDPSSGDILLYEYIYDIHTQKMMDEITFATAKYDYERVASVNLNANQMTVIHLDLSTDTHKLSTWNYTDKSLEYGNSTVFSEDLDHYLAHVSLAYVRAQLACTDRYEFVHRVVESDGSIGFRRNCYSYYNREMGICLMTRADVTKVMLEEESKSRQLSAALEQAQTALATAEAATLAKSEFLSRMSHEIRTPMNAIMGMTAIAKENRSDFVQVNECLDKIDMSSHFLLTLINDILEMSRIESGRTELKRGEFSFEFLIESIRTVVEPMALKGEIRYEFLNNAITDSHYLGDGTRIQQLLVNLISNAIKFTRPGGRVRFTISIDSETSQCTHFRFVIADTGIGMSETFMKRMFRPFTQEDGSNTSEYSGSGLGLAISKSLAEAMGGSIHADSFPNIGSTFIVKLPLERISYSVTSAPVTAKPVSDDFSLLKHRQILMAEDHPLNVMVATKLLERKDAIVTVAANGQRAVELFQQSDPYFYDAILMDIRMPVLDGWDATRAIRRLQRSDAAVIPIIAMTANALEEDRRHSREAGMNAHLAKPFEPIQLYHILVEALTKAQNDKAAQFNQI